MIRNFCFSLALLTATLPLRAANTPHAGTDSRQVWTNDSLAKRHTLGLISIVGQMDREKPTSASATAGYVKTQDPEWYAVEAEKLRGELESRQAQLREYQRVLDDARSLGKSTGGIDLVGEDFAITPEAGIEILQQRVIEDQQRLDDVEDLARRNDIEPGTLRGQ
jgi:hypothetical protein